MPYSLQVSSHEFTQRLPESGITDSEIHQQEDGMLAYVNLVQAREKKLGVDVLTHQKWSGAAYVDGMLGAIQSGSSGSKSMGEGNTESGKSDLF